MKNILQISLAIFFYSALPCAAADSYTPNYNFRIIDLDVEDEETPWGEKINDNFTTMDQAIYSLSITTSSLILSATSQSVANTIVKRDASGNFSASTITAAKIAATGTINSPSISISGTGFRSLHDGSASFGLTETREGKILLRGPNGDILLTSGCGPIQGCVSTPMHPNYSATLEAAAGYTGGLNIGIAGSNPIIFYTNSTEALRINPNGGLDAISSFTARGGFATAAGIGKSLTCAAGQTPEAITISSGIIISATCTPVGVLSATQTFTGENTFASVTATTTFSGYVDYGLVDVTGPGSISTDYATCPAGKYIVSGGCSTSVGNCTSVSSYKYSSTQWLCSCGGAPSPTMVATATCGRVK